MVTIKMSSNFNLCHPVRHDPVSVRSSGESRTATCDKVLYRHRPNSEPERTVSEIEPEWPMADESAKLSHRSESAVDTPTIEPPLKGAQRPANIAAILKARKLNPAAQSRPGNSSNFKHGFYSEDRNVLKLRARSVRCFSDQHRNRG